MDDSVKKGIVKMLTLLGLSINKPYSKEMVSNNFRKLSKKYHPDVAEEKYKDGEKFKEILNAKDFLISNIDEVNDMIEDGLDDRTSYNSYEEYEYRRRYEEQRRKEEEQERKRQEKENLYAKCCNLYNNLNIKNEDDVSLAKRIINNLQSIDPYKESKQIISSIKNKISAYYEQKKKEEEIRREKERIAQLEKTYNNACKLLDVEITKQNKREFINAIDVTEELNYKDSIEIHFKLKKKYSEFLEKEKARLLVLRKKVIKFASVFAAAITVLIVSIVLIVNLVIIPKQEYNKKEESYNNAIEQIAKGNFSSAESTLYGLDFNDSKEIYQLLQARKEFVSGDYEKGIDIVYKSGGTTNIRYDGLGGECNKEEEVIKLSSYVTNESKKRGYEFNKWVLQDYSMDYKEHSVSLVLAANYSEIVYSITYNYVGKDFDGPTEYKITDELNIANPTKVGYKFLGWKVSDSDDLIKDLKIKDCSCDLNLTATYEAKEYSITFDTVGGSVDSNTKKVKFDSFLELPTPEKTGYEFMGWFYNDEAFNDCKWEFDSNLTIKAKWKACIYKIEYQNISNTEKIGLPTQYEFSDLNSFAIPSITRNGYTFISWVCNDSKIDKIPSGNIGDVTLYPEFEANKYIVTYNYNDNNHDNKNTEIVYDSNVVLETVDSRDYYTFAGWYLNNVLFDSSKWKILDNITLVAKWNPIEYGINYNVDSTVTNNNPSTYNIETEVILSQPTRSNYTFAGWYLDQGFNNLATSIGKGNHEEKTFYPKWIDNTNLCTYVDIDGATQTHSAITLNNFSDSNEWYYIAGVIVLEELNITKNTYFILMKDSQLIVNTDLHIKTDITLTVYSEDGACGKIYAVNSIGSGKAEKINEQPTIISGKIKQKHAEIGGYLTVAGGTIIAKSICDGADGIMVDGIDYVRGGMGGTVKIYNGTINCESMCNGGIGADGNNGLNGGNGRDEIEAYYYDPVWDEYFQIYDHYAHSGDKGGQGGTGGTGGQGGTLYIYGGLVNCNYFSNGGQGGKGGTGGNGGAGGNSMSGYPAAEGGQGGTGGTGGRGGQNGKVYSIYNLPNVICCQGGTGGQGGLGGTGGPGIKTGLNGDNGNDGDAYPSGSIEIIN